MKFVVLTAAVMLWANTCEDAIIFDKPQPNGAKPLTEIPTKFRGEYLNTTDSSYLVIERSVISLHKTEIIGLSTTEIRNDSTALLLGDSVLVDRRDGTRFGVRCRGDSIFVMRQQLDTVFTIESNDVACRFKGQLIISSNAHGEGWLVNSFDVKDNRLVKIEFASRKTFDILAPKSRSLVKTEPNANNPAKIDTVAMYLMPTRKEFGQFLKLEPLIQTQEYVRVTSGYKFLKK